MEGEDIIFAIGCIIIIAKPFLFKNKFKTNRRKTINLTTVVLRY